MNVTRAWRMVLGLLVAACLSLLPSLAYAEDDSPAYEIFDNYLNQSNSVSEFNNYLINDLATRWFYADASKRAKVPVIQSAWTNVDGSLETILEEAGGNPSDASYEFSTCQAIVSYVDVPALPSQLYKLVTFDNGLAWDSSAMQAREYFRDWYEWFEGAGSDTLEYPVPEYVTVSGLAGVAWDSRESIVGQTAQLHFTNYQSLNNDMNRTGYKYMFVWTSTQRYSGAGNGGIGPTMNYCFSKSPISVVIEPGSGFTGTNAGTSNYVLNFSSQTAMLIRTNVTSDTPPVTNAGIRDGVASINSASGINRGTSWTYSQFYSPTTSNYYWFPNVVGAGAGGGSDVVVYPDLPTPKVPDTPTTPSEPTNITINWNNNSYTNNQTTTTTVDLQPILDAIRIVNDNLESGFLGLEADIRSCYDGMEHLFTSWFEYFGSWFQTISTQLDTWFRLFLQEMRTANSWLRAIYYKSFGGNSSQPDVTSDTDDYWNWLFELLARIIEMLPDSLQEIITQLAQLQNYFPFSVPWDIAFLLGLLDAQPVTPVIHGYLPTWGANGFVAQGVPLDIDLSEFDDIALLLRRAELIFFAITLLPVTYDVLKGFREVLQS